FAARRSHPDVRCRFLGAARGLASLAGRMPTLRPWILVLATTFAGGCAHREATRTSAAPDPLAALRGENAALRRRVQILEDRVVRLETQGIDPELEAEAAPSG